MLYPLTGVSTAINSMGVTDGAALGGPIRKRVTKCIAERSKAAWPAPGATLDLDFANDRGYVFGRGIQSATSLIEFNRASAGGRVNSLGQYETVTADVARLDYDPLAAGRTNLLLYSEQFESGAWGVFGTVTKTANTHVAPNGNMAGESLTIAAASGIYQSVLANTNSLYTISCYVRGDTAQTVRFVSNTDLSEVITTTVTVTSTWQRAVITRPTTTGTIVNLQWDSSSTGAAFQVWGAQIEAGPSATEYIPTTATQVTRRAWARTNIFSYSQQLDNAVWLKNGLTVSPNVTTAPDGTSTADKLVEANTSQYNYIYKNRTASNETLTVSFYVKQAGRKYFKIQYTDNVLYVAAAIFDLNLGTVFSTSAPNVEYTNIYASIYDAGSGWYRVSLTASKAAVNPDNVASIFLVANDGSTVLYTGDGTSGVYIWGAQLEQSDYVTPYIPTEAAAVTVPPMLTCRGLLTEEARTNLLTYSDMLDNAAWGGSGLTITANATTAPDGTATADKIIAAATLAEHARNRSGPTLTVANSFHTISVYAKAAELSQIKVSLTNGAYSSSTSYIFTLTGAGLVGSAEIVGPATNCSASISSVGLGWYRCAVTCVVDAVSTTVNHNFSTASGGTAYHTGNAVDGLYIWGAQLEVGPSATTYIPTTTTSVARYADIAQMTGTNFSSWYRQDEGTFLVEFDANSPTDPSYLRVWEVTDSTFNLTNLLLVKVSGVAFYYTAASIAGAIQVSYLPSGTVSPNVMNRIATSYGLNDFSQGHNGAASVTDNLGNVPLVDRLRIGSDNGGSSNLGGHIKRLVYFPNKIDTSNLSL